MSKEPDKTKALQAALDMIEKQFGKGSIMKMSDEHLKIVDAISTGSINLDIALGIKGLPRGRITELYGPESAGKCLTKDSFVWTDKGLETVEEIFSRAGLEMSNTNKITDIQDHDIQVVNEYGELEQVSHLTHNGKKPVFEIELQSGRKIKLTHNHPIRVLNEQGFVVWKNAGNLQEGDIVVSALFGSNSETETSLTETEAELIGMLTADGNLTNKTSLRYTKKYKDEQERYISLVQEVFGTEHDIKIYNQQEIHINNKSLREFVCNNYGLDYLRSADKHVPTVVRKSNINTQVSFLNGLFGGDSHFTSTQMEWATASKKLSEQVQIMLFGLGISSSLREKIVNEVVYYRVNVTGSSFYDLMDIITVYGERRQKQIQDVERTSWSSQSTNIPHINPIIVSLRDALGGDREFAKLTDDLFNLDIRCSQRRLNKILQWAEQKNVEEDVSASLIYNQLKMLASRSLTFETVTGIHKNEAVPTFDMMVPGSHSFIANGILVHNTTLVYHVIAEVQKKGGKAAFIDAEHALDPEYARNIGVDVDELLISQPSTGEEALEITDLLARSGAVDFIAVDSVAALTPKAELEGAMGQQTVGLQARMMSQAMRKLTGSLNKTNTCLLFTNQIREKVGVMFGCFPYDAQVVLADGTTEKIGRIVEEQLSVKVRSLNPKTGVITNNEVVGWFNNGVNDDKWLKISVDLPTGSSTSFQVTPNHTIITPVGEVSAEELSVGDTVFIDSGEKQTSQGIVSNVEEVDAVGEWKYDLEIDNDHTYFVEHVAVHNSPETQPGGRALKFYSSVRLDIRRTGSVKAKNEDGVEEIVANETRVKVVKNKVAPPFKQAEFQIRFGKGILREGELIDLSVEKGVMKKSGAFYSFDGETVGQGKEKTIAFLKDPENKEVADEIERQLWAIINPAPVEDTEAPPSDEEIEKFESELDDK